MTGEWSEPMSMDEIEREIMERPRPPKTKFRNECVYALGDGSMAMKLEFPDGFVPPLEIKMFRPKTTPLGGDYVFYLQQSYRIKLKPYALQVDYDGDHA